MPFPNILLVIIPSMELRSGWFLTWFDSTVGRFIETQSPIYVHEEPCKPIRFSYTHFLIKPLYSFHQTITCFRPGMAVQNSSDSSTHAHENMQIWSSLSYPYPYTFHTHFYYHHSLSTPQASQAHHPYFIFHPIHTLI